MSLGRGLRHVGGHEAVEAGVAAVLAAGAQARGAGEHAAAAPLQIGTGLDAAVAGGAVDAALAAVGRAAGREAGQRDVAVGWAADIEDGQRAFDALRAGLQPDLGLAALQRGQCLATVGVDRQVGHDLAFDALAPARVNEPVGGDGMAERHPWRRETLRIVGGRGAVRLHALAVQAGVAQAQPGGVVGAQCHTVAQVELVAALVAVGVRGGRCRLCRRDGAAVDVAGAGQVVGLPLEAALEPARQPADGDVMAQAGELHGSAGGDVERRGVSVFVLAAEVVEVVAAVGAEAGGVVAAVGGRAAEGVGQAVVGTQALDAERRLGAPSAAQLVLHAQRRVQVVEHDRLAPGLVVEVEPGVDLGRFGQRFAQQAEALLAGLGLSVELHFRLDEGVGADAPVGGDGDVVRAALGVAQRGLQVGGGEVHAQAELAAGAEALRVVDAALKGAALDGFDPQRRAVLGQRALDDEVHEAGRRAGAGLDAGAALEDLDA
mmetsp:Transcript_37512/g.87389  ORF Transcript_37512/g.87389 Transcript_37512/m.87389 type:complete len:490 (+) Transcript_37512:4831-6300(+)